MYGVVNSDNNFEATKLHHAAVYSQQVPIREAFLDYNALQGMNIIITMVPSSGGSEQKWYRLPYFTDRMTSSRKYGG